MEKQGAKKDAIEINDTTGFEQAINPFIEKRSEVEKKLVSLKDGLLIYQREKEALQAKLATAVREAQGAISRGQRPNDDAIRIKLEMEQFSQWIDIAKKGIAETEAELKAATDKLVLQIKKYVVPLKDIALQRMNATMEQGINEGVAFIEYIDTLFKTHGLKVVIPWWEQDSLMRLVPSFGKGLPQRVRELMGLME